jgi:hypothetical protein
LINIREKNAPECRICTQLPISIELIPQGNLQMSILGATKFKLFAIIQKFKQSLLNMRKKTQHCKQIKQIQNEETPSSEREVRAYFISKFNSAAEFHPTKGAFILLTNPTWHQNE